MIRTFFKISVKCVFVLILIFLGACSDINNIDNNSNYKFQRKYIPNNLITIKGIEFYIEDSIPFINNLGFEILQEIYSYIDFRGVFKQGDENLKEKFLDKFYNLLLENSSLYVREGMLLPSRIDGYLYLSEIIQDFNPLLYEYYFLDFNGDGTPELAILAERSLFVIQYISYEDKFVLWFYIPPSYTTFIGTKKLSVGGGVFPIYYSFIELDIYGNENIKIEVYINEIISKNGDLETMYFLTLPKGIYLESIYIKELLEQSINIEFTDNIYFRVTREQFDKIMSDFYYSRFTAYQELERLRFSFKELFN
ncbi:MAG: hypothetical protein FWF57_00520 [Defluviitaleaceae bacterium]|nr:hypothetical protein [Defluviitaleaceae bacterium]